MFRSKDKAKSPSGGTGTSQKIAHYQRDHNAISCGEVKDRERACCVGEIVSTRIVPRGLSHWFEVVISDGTGKVNGWFFGRKGIDGMHLGSVVLFEGLVQLDQGEHTIANPYYEFL